MSARTSELKRVFIISGEHSGDALGAGLMAALRARCGKDLTFAGVGGERMEAAGLISLFPLDEIAVMGPVAIVRRLPQLISRVYDCVDACLDAEPDLLVIIDAPEFTHPVARRVRVQRPEMPIVNYVSPTVWAWRPGRARKMKPYVDHLLALLPFEPEAHARLGGPPCTYVGHPLIEQLEWYRALDATELAERLRLSESSVPVVVLPGSRRSEASRLMKPFGETIAALVAQGRKLEVLIPAVPHLREEIAEASRSWAAPVHIVNGQDDKWRAFKLGRAALAASGTVTLELALAGTPMVVAYKVDALATWLRYVVNVPSIVLANLILGENAFPEFLQENCVPEKLAPALAAVLDDGAARQSQVNALARISERMQAAGPTPSLVAADATLKAVADFHTARFARILPANIA